MKTAVVAAKKNLPANWEQTMKEDARKGRAAVATIGVSARLKTRGGILQYMDAPMPGNKMPAVILAAAPENALYEGEFDPDNPSSPICFAFADMSLEPEEREAAMAPHDKSEKKQSKDCASCKHNKWGSAEKGRGKACKNQFHLRLIHADDLKKAVGKGGLDAALVVTVNVPPTSLPSFAQYTKGLESNTGKPPYAFTTEVAIVPDPKVTWKMQFTPLKEIDRKVMPLVFMKAKEAEQALAERPPYMEMEGAAPKKPAKKAKKKF